MSTSDEVQVATPADEEAIGSALMQGAPPGRAGMLGACLAFGWRGLLKIRHVPEQLIDATLTPVLMLLMFTYLFGGALEGSTGDYLQFLLPGVLVMSVLFTTVYSGVALNTDMTKGVVDRFRSLPIARPAPLVGAVLGDGARYAVAATVVVLLGLVMGFRPDGGVSGVVAAMALVVVFAFGLAWVFTTVGLLLRAPNAVMNAGFMSLFPLLFLSNIFVDPATLPDWLKAFVDVNPVSLLTTVSRDLMAGSGDVGDVALVLGITALLTAVFAPLTVWLYRRG